MNMLNKAKMILGSLRFWIVTLTAVTAVLEAIVGGTFTIEFVFNTVQVWLAAVVTIGTLDSVATKFGAASKK